MGPSTARRAWRGPIAWAQRAIIEADVVNDLTQRLKFYAANPGTVLTARDPASGALLGFADVELSAYDVARSQYRLPGARAATTAAAAPRSRGRTSQPGRRPESRKRSVGRMLVRACEEVRGWGALEAEPEPTVCGSRSRRTTRPPSPSTSGWGTRGRASRSTARWAARLPLRRGQRAAAGPREELAGDVNFECQDPDRPGRSH